MTIAKNYLNAEELDQLNRLVSLFLDFAELRARQRQNLRMADWRAYVDNFLAFNESPLLDSAGQVSHESMVSLVHERYEQFDATRRQEDARRADQEDLAELARAPAGADAGDDLQALEQVEKDLLARQPHR